MKFRFIWIGKTKTPHWRGLQDEYLGRLTRFVRSELVELKDTSPPGDLQREGRSILKRLKDGDHVVVLDINGTRMSSHRLAEEIRNYQDRSLQNVSFIIGGFNGISAEVAERANLRLSLSFLTFTHEMTRVILLEQLYRAYTILNGFPYQK